MRSKVIFACLVLGLVAALAAPAIAFAGREGIAILDGKLIDLRYGWGEAEACLVADTNAVARCFRSEKELLEHIDGAEEVTELVGEGVVAASACSSSLRLYDGTNYTGAVLYLSQRTTWINLSSYGWSNRTSSFKVGACSAYMADLSNGGGDWYPTSATTAGKVASTIVSGWNNRVSSVYIR